MKLEIMNAFKAPELKKEKVFFGVAVAATIVKAASDITCTIINGKTQKQLAKQKKLNKEEIASVVKETLEQICAEGVEQPVEEPVEVVGEC